MRIYGKITDSVIFAEVIQTTLNLNSMYKFPRYKYETLTTLGLSHKRVYVSRPHNIRRSSTLNNIFRNMRPLIGCISLYGEVPISTLSVPSWGCIIFFDTNLFFLTLLKVIQNCIYPLSDFSSSI